MAATQGEAMDSGREAVAGLRREVTTRVRMAVKKGSCRRSTGTKENVERRKNVFRGR